MFGFFKRTKIEAWEIALLSGVIEKLPKEYASLTDQIKDGLLRGVLVGVSDIPEYVAFTFNSNVLKKYDKVNDRDYKITNIKVYDAKTSSFLPYEIYISSGTISGYSLGGGKSKKIDLNRIDVLGFKKQFIGEFDYERILSVLNENEKSRINPSDVYPVFVGDKEYFHIKDLEDGDFIGIDIEKNVYKITHDPLRVSTLNKKIVDVLSEDYN